MKKILTIAVVAILTLSFVNASNINGGKNGNNAKAKSTTHIKYVKFKAKDFCTKKMQDTKDILLPMTPRVIDNTPSKS